MATGTGRLETQPDGLEQAGDLPAAGDWDADGKDEIAVFRSGGWYFDKNGDGYWTAGDTTGWF